MVVTKRLNWLKWLYPGEAGLQSDQDWHIDKRREHMKGDLGPGVSSGLEVLETSPTPDLEVHVQVGRAIGGDGEEIVLTSIVDVDLSSYAAGGATVKIVAEYAEVGTDPYIVPETATSQDKFLQDDPTITVITGAPAANQIVLAQVVVSNGATQIIDAVDPENPGTNEINLRFQTIRTDFGLRMTKSQLGAPLSAVTVGEAGCDFTDVQSAITYISTLMRSNDRQCVIYLFEKRDGQDWSVSSAITIPSWTHFIGMGKPTLKTSVTTGDAITLSEGASIENVCIENSATGWTNQIASSADDVTIRNVDVRHEHASVNAGYAIGIKQGSRIRVENFRLLPNAATPTNACRGISFATADEVTDVEITNCSLDGDQLLLEQLGGNALRRLHVRGLRLIGRSTTATFVLGNIATALYASSFVDVYGECPAGPGTGLRIVVVSSSDPKTVLSNIRLKCTGLGDIILLNLSNCNMSSFSVYYGRLILALNSRASVGHVIYAYDDTTVAVALGDECALVNCEVSRGGRDAPGVGPAATATKVVVSGCHVRDTGTENSIKGAVNCNDWYVSNCVVKVATDPNTGTGWVYGNTFTSHEKVA